VNSFRIWAKSWSNTRVGSIENFYTRYTASSSFPLILCISNSVTSNLYDAMEAP